MDRSRCSPLHPLLLERSYWRNRLQELELLRGPLLIVPRPELSSTFAEIEEFRVKGHDGVRLWGLKGRACLRGKPTSIRVRLVGPCEVPDIDPIGFDESAVEYVYQAPAGRRLEDRVLDAVRVARSAADREKLPLTQLRFLGEGRLEPDEFRIARELLEGEPRS